MYIIYPVYLHHQSHVIYKYTSYISYTIYIIYFLFTHKYIYLIHSRSFKFDKVNCSYLTIIASRISYLKLLLLSAVVLLISQFIEYLSLAPIATKYFAVIHSLSPVAFPNY